MARARREQIRGMDDGPSGPVAFALGFVLGALAGTATLGLELALLGWMGVGVPGPEGLAFGMATYAVVGGLIGALNASLGLWAGGWAFGWSVVALGLLFGGKAGAVAVDSGMPGALGILVLVGLGLAVAQIAGRIGGIGPVHVGAGAALAVFGAVAGGLNLHLLPSATDPLALMVDGLAAGAALLVGIFVGMLSSGERAPVPQLVLANGVMALLVWPLMGAQMAIPATEQPGTPVVWITVEGLRADIPRRDSVETPHLDRFLSRGLRFDNAHTTAPWAIPALASLHTGRLPHHHGAAMNDGVSNHMGPVGAEVPTAAMILEREGYVTGAAVGDSFLDPFGLHAGFQWFSDTAAQGPIPLWVDALAVARGIAPWPVRQDAAAVTDQSLAFVEAQQGGKWFLWAHYVDPGRPFLAAEHDRQTVGKTRRPWPVDAYDASLLTLDRELGRLLEGLPDGAIVVLAGTHGMQLEEERPRRPGVPWSAVDGHSVFQELVHVPLAVHGPGIPSASVRRPVSLIDVLPGLIHRLGIERVPKLDGTVWQELGVDPPEGKVPVLAMSVRWGAELQMVRVDDDKLILRPDGSSPLYDLAADGREITARPADARNEQLERRLKSALPPIDAGPRLFERSGPLERLGRWLQATWDRRPRPAAKAMPAEGAAEP